MAQAVDDRGQAEMAVDLVPTCGEIVPTVQVPILLATLAKSTTGTHPSTTLQLLTMAPIVG